MKIKKSHITGTFILLILFGLAIFQLKSNSNKKERLNQLSKDICKEFPVKVAKVEIKEISNPIQSSGVLKAAQELVLKSETNGLVLNLYMQDGSYVKKGEVIAQVENKVLKANYILAKANYKQALADYHRYKNLVKISAVTQQQFEKVELNKDEAYSKMVNTQKLYDDSFIKATSGGYIEQLNIEQGDLVSKGSTICKIIDIHSMELNVAVTEKEIVRIKKNNKVELKVSSLALLNFEARIEYLSLISDNYQRYNVKVKVKNKDLKLKSGMYSNIKIFPNKRRSFLINRKAIIGGLNDAKVYVLKGDKVELRNISTGETFKNKVEVIKGIEEDEIVVTSGMINLINGSKVKKI
jgi:RND family efflux transporter MFP subunit